MKAFNLLINKHEYLKFSVCKVGKPSGFMLDTVNACQLGCPSCQHSANRKWVAMTYTPLPKGSLKRETFDTFMRTAGIYAYSGHFYNNSEPFLNKKTPEYLRIAHVHRIRTFVSSNMSIPKLDAEAIVASGLDTLMTAIDGTTQDVYERYRKGGKLELAFENVRNIVAAKKKLGSPTPHLRWQLLTFQHNIHQVEDAIEMAKGIGYDSFNVATPFDVSEDDPSVIAIAHPRASELIFFTKQISAPWKHNVDEIQDDIESAFDEDLPYYGEPDSNPTIGRCDWLHVGVIADALGRIHPCCIPDYQSHGSFVFGDVKDPFNGPGHIDARKFFAGQSHNKTKCDTCTYRPLPQIGLGAIGWYGDALATQYIDWSRHTAN